MNKTTKTALKVKSTIKAAGMNGNHNRALAALKVKSSIKAAGMNGNHNRAFARA
jgi:hypothetical protein